VNEQHFTFAGETISLQACSESTSNWRARRRLLQLPACLIAQRHFSVARLSGRGRRAPRVRRGFSRRKLCTVDIDQVTSARLFDRELLLLAPSSGQVAPHGRMHRSLHKQHGLLLLRHVELAKNNIRLVGDVPSFFCASNKSGKRSGDIQSNNAKQAVADRTEDGAAIPPQPFEPKPARDAVFR
jgi:hypothetical protein